MDINISQPLPPQLHFFILRGDVLVRLVPADEIEGHHLIPTALNWTQISELQTQGDMGLYSGYINYDTLTKPSRFSNQSNSLAPSSFSTQEPLRYPSFNEQHHIQISHLSNAYPVRQTPSPPVRGMPITHAPSGNTIQQSLSRQPLAAIETQSYRTDALRHPVTSPQDTISPSLAMDRLGSSAYSSDGVADAASMNHKWMDVVDRVPPSGNRIDHNRKIYCSHWIRTGNCDYTQQGCMFKHEMPDDATLERIGVRDGPPRWWLEENHMTLVDRWRPSSSKRPNHQVRKPMKANCAFTWSRGYEPPNPNDEVVAEVEKRQESRDHKESGNRKRQGDTQQPAATKPHRSRAPPNTPIEPSRKASSKAKASTMRPQRSPDVARAAKAGRSKAVDQQQEATTTRNPTPTKSPPAQAALTSKQSDSTSTPDHVKQGIGDLLSFSSLVANHAVPGAARMEKNSPTEPATPEPLPEHLVDVDITPTVESPLASPSTSDAAETSGAASPDYERDLLDFEPDTDTEQAVATLNGGIESSRYADLSSESRSPLNSSSGSDSKGVQIRPRGATSKRSRRSSPRRRNAPDPASTSSNPKMT